jgi:hypothetical protein
MKKLLLYFSLFIFNFSPCSAQDTLFLRNGNKLGVSVISYGSEIVYTIPPNDKQLSISSSKVSSIKYKDGFIYKNNNASYDISTIKFKPYMVVSAGGSVPIFTGYGGNSYSTDQFGYGYSGYAYNGSVFSATAGLSISKGWELTGMFSYIRNGFNATAVMQETAVLFVDYYYSYTNLNLENANAIGSYNYVNYSGLLGFTKSWKNKYFTIGISLMGGEFISTMPALYGTTTNVIYNSQGTYSSTNCSFTMSAETQKNLVIETGLHLDVNITHHIFVRGLAELLFSDITHGGPYQVTVGNITYAGEYSSIDSRNTNLFVGLFNATAGLGYKF